MADPITPSAARLLALHDAVIGGAARALEQIWVELHRPLCQRLRRRFRTAPVDLIEDAATDAIRTYGVNPLAFDRTRDVPLDIFVSGIGVRLLRDRLRTEKRRAAREIEYAARQVAYESADRATQCVLAHEMRSALRDVCDDIERGAIEACLDRDDDDAVAAYLGVSALPEADQRNAKKRLWDAAVKRLRRLLSRGGHHKAKAQQEKVNGRGANRLSAANT
jgi:hypothetical protein